MKNIFPRTSPSLLMAAAIIAAMSTLPAVAQSGADEEPGAIAGSVSTRVLSAVSGGFWQQTAETASEGDKEASTQEQRGYYRIVAVRSADNTSRLYLQRIQLAADGPTMLDSTEIAALSEMKAYITDMRPESSTGIAQEPGFAAFIYLKSDPAASEPDTYELFVDEFGDADFALATN